MARSKPPAPITAQELSKTGSVREQFYKEEFVRLLRSGAVLHMKRRRSETLVDSDFDEAYRLLLTSQRRPLAFEIAADVCFVLGGALISLGVNLLTAAAPNWFMGTIIVGAGLAFGTVAAMFRHVPI